MGTVLNRLAWIAAAILGIALAVALAYATSQLANQRVGLGSSGFTPGERGAAPPLVPPRGPGRPYRPERIGPEPFPGAGPLSGPDADHDHDHRTGEGPDDDDD